MLLSEYIVATQLLIHDRSYQTVTQTDLTSYINRGRRRVAERTQCVRTLLAGEGPILSVTVLNGGSGYSNPTVTISGGMGTGAVLQAVVDSTPGSGSFDSGFDDSFDVGVPGGSGAITAINVLNGGSNYSPPLVLTISDATGVGATAIAVQGPLLQTVVGQETYTYLGANSYLPTGYLSILDILSVACNWGGMKPALDQIPWIDMQAYYRAYAVPTLGQPIKWAKYGQGARGSIYLWMIPSTAQSMDWDCVCLPVPLVDDTTVDVIPEPFDDAVPYYAAYLCLLNAQRWSEAKEMKEEYVSRSGEARADTSAPMIPSFYSDSW